MINPAVKVLIFCPFSSPGGKAPSPPSVPVPSPIAPKRLAATSLISFAITPNAANASVLLLTCSTSSSLKPMRLEKTLPMPLPISARAPTAFIIAFIPCSTKFIAPATSLIVSIILLKTYTKALAPFLESINPFTNIVSSVLIKFPA